MPHPLSDDHPVRWGILGCGQVAGVFARDLRLLPDQVITAVASLTPGKGAAFAQEHGVPVALMCYEDLVVRDDVDVVYIATTHDRHYPNARLALSHGKAVLCEKPITLNAQQTEHLIQLSIRHDAFLMEAMWTRFFPMIEALLADLVNGVIGPLRLLQADFGVREEWAPSHRMVDPARGGGSLLDLGVYPVSLAHLLFASAPNIIHGLRRPSERGVDAQFTGLLGFPGDGQALLSSSYDVRVPPQARLFGPEGSIVIDDFFHPTSYTIIPHGGKGRLAGHRISGRGYQYEIAEVSACLRAGRRESLRRPLEETLAVMQTMDALRQTWGQRYPNE